MVVCVAPSPAQGSLRHGPPMDGVCWATCLSGVGHPPIPISIPPLQDWTPAPTPAPLDRYRDRMPQDDRHGLDSLRPMDSRDLYDQSTAPSPRPLHGDLPPSGSGRQRMAGPPPEGLPSYEGRRPAYGDPGPLPRSRGDPSGGAWHADQPPDEPLKPHALDPYARAPGAERARDRGADGPRHRHRHRDDQSGDAGDSGLGDRARHREGRDARGAAPTGLYDPLGGAAELHRYSPARPQGGRAWTRDRLDEPYDEGAGYRRGQRGGEPPGDLGYPSPGAAQGQGYKSGALADPALQPHRSVVCAGRGGGGAGNLDLDLGAELTGCLGVCTMVSFTTLHIAWPCGGGSIRMAVHRMRSGGVPPAARPK